MTTCLTSYPMDKEWFSVLYLCFYTHINIGIPFMGSGDATASTSDFVDSIIVRGSQNWIQNTSEGRIGVNVQTKITLWVKLEIKAAH